uniref:Uncharacterized protein n=1 Tax=Ditylenchus dipsaci TaxID=166011 RepID=A0A915CXV8_9BILA
MEPLHTVSTRLIKPTQPDIHLDELLRLEANWDTDEVDQLYPAIFDEECAQYLLANDLPSHLKFFAALVRGEPTLRCRLIKVEPENCIENQPKGKENALNIISKSNEPLDMQQSKQLEKLMNVLGKRGYRFQKTNLISVCANKIAML